MADSTLSLVYSNESGRVSGSSALRWAKSLLEAGRLADARTFLETSLEHDVFDIAPEKATALLALALLERTDGHCRAALGLLDRAETALVLTENERDIVRWDVLLAKALVLADCGKTAESAACARTALALFDDSDYAVALHRPLLLHLERLALTDGGDDGDFLVPRALGVLHLSDDEDARGWLRLQEAVFEELVRRGSLEVAVKHAYGTISALPADLLGAGDWWVAVVRFLERVDAEAAAAERLPFAEMFEALEWEYFRSEDYEDQAPLLPRERAAGY